MAGGQIPVAIAGIEEVRLLEMLGTGAFASAWKVVDVATDAPYVLKIIQGIKPGSVDAERVRLEASVSILSEHVVPVIGLCEWDPSTFLILFEYFPGQSLDKLIEGRMLADDQKKRIFSQTLMGVSDAHRCNVIHRDLKPANILVSDDGQAKLIDFGISKFKGKGLTLSGAIIGTFEYMAPELMMGHGAKVADARADIFSLGHILYELAMGQHFWARKGWHELGDLLGYLTQSPAPTEVIELDDFHCSFYREAPRVLQGMAKINPDERYHSVDEVMSELGYLPYLTEPPADLHLRSPLLIVESGSNRGARTVLGLEDGQKRLIGRADIAGNDESISRRHCEISRTGEHYFVRDLDSKNGTMVRGIAYGRGHSPVEIHHADRIKVGDVFLRFAFLRTV
jgi:serine/threonine-protein kinase